MKTMWGGGWSNEDINLDWFLSGLRFASPHLPHDVNKSSRVFALCNSKAMVETGNPCLQNSMFLQVSPTRTRTHSTLPSPTRWHTHSPISYSHTLTLSHSLTHPHTHSHPLTLTPHSRYPSPAHSPTHSPTPHSPTTRSHTPLALTGWEWERGRISWVWWGFCLLTFRKSRYRLATKKCSPPHFRWFRTNSFSRFSKFLPIPNACTFWRQRDILPILFVLLLLKWESLEKHRVIKISSFWHAPQISFGLFPAAENDFTRKFWNLTPLDHFKDIVDSEFWISTPFRDKRVGKMSLAVVKNS